MFQVLRESLALSSTGASATPHALRHKILLRPLPSTHLHVRSTTPILVGAHGVEPMSLATGGHAMQDGDNASSRLHMPEAGSKEFATVATAIC